MKITTSIVPLITLAAASSLQAQSLANIPTDVSGFSSVGPPSWTYSDPILGNVTATYITDNNTTRNAYRNINPGAEPGFVREGYFAYRNNPNGVDDITGTEQLVFSWDNPVDTLLVALGDFDENNNGPSILFSDANLNSVGVGDIGEEAAENGYTYSTSGTTFTLDSRGPSNLGLTNGRIYNSVDVVLNGTGLTSFTLEGVNTDINALEVGGPTLVPEPSTTLLGALAGLGLLARRRR